MGASEGFPNFSGRDSKKTGRKSKESGRKSKENGRKSKGFFFEKPNVYTDLRDSLNRSIAGFA
jgi:hypothetical protein